MNQGVMEVSYDLLCSALRLPQGSEIVVIGQNFDDQTKNVFRVLVRHPDLPVVMEGETSPVVELCIRYDDSGNALSEWTYW